MKRGSQKSAFWISNRGLDIYWILSIRVLVLVKVYRVKTNGKTGNKKIMFLCLGQSLEGLR